MTDAIRYDNEVYEIGDYLPCSRVWDDGEITREELGGTSCLTIDQDPYTGERCYGVAYAHKYVVKGIWITDGNDDGEIVLRDCRVIEILR